MRTSNDLKWAETENRPDYVRQQVTAEVKAVNKAKREVLHLISTPSVDRAGDIVEPAGAQIDNFMINPVVLLNHNASVENVIGRALNLTIDDNGIFARTKFLKTAAGDAAFALTQEGIGGWSIGFRPVEFDAIRDDKGRQKGFRFSKWELLEYSSVAIPMNQDVVNSAIKRGLMAPDQVGLFFDVGEDEAQSTPVNSAPQKANVETRDVLTETSSAALRAAIEKAEFELEVREARQRMLALAARMKE